MLYIWMSNSKLIRVYLRAAQKERKRILIRCHGQTNAMDYQKT